MAAALMGAVAIFVFQIIIGKKDVRLLIAAAALAAAALGLLRADMFLARWDAQTLPAFAHGQRAMVVAGTIVADPDRRDNTTHVEVTVSSANNTPKSGELVAYLPPRAQVHYGDQVVLSGTLDLPQPFGTDAGNLFDYPHYLEVHGISATLSQAQLQSSQAAGFSLKGALYEAKARFNASLERTLPVPESMLMEGILLGERRGLSDDLTAAFVAAGLIHIVILAGYVLSIVADAVLRALKFLPQRFRYPLAGALLILFVLMTGAAATTVRASIMALISLLARYFNRRSVALRSLALAAMGMALWNPPMLVWDSSFIISFLATFGLITMSPAVERWLTFLPEKHELRAIATSTLCVQLFALPALLYYTGNLSFFSVPANLLALPVLPWAMLFGFVGGLFNFLPGALGFVLSFIPAILAWLALKWILFIVWLVSLVPSSSITLQAFPAWLAFLIYIPLIIYAIHVYQKNLPLT